MRSLGPKASFALLAAGALLGACAMAPGDAVGGRPDVQRAVMDHYRQYATEENWRCLDPTMESVTAWSVVDEGPDQLVVNVRYYYKDWFKSDINDDGIFRFPARTCQGFNERLFTVDLDVEPVAIATMSGPTRMGPRGFGG